MSEWCARGVIMIKARALVEFYLFFAMKFPSRSRKSLFHSSQACAHNRKNSSLVCHIHHMSVQAHEWTEREKI